MKFRDDRDYGHEISITTLNFKTYIMLSKTSNQSKKNYVHN